MEWYSRNGFTLEMQIIFNKQLMENILFAIHIVIALVQCSNSNYSVAIVEDKDGHSISKCGFGL